MTLALTALGILKRVPWQVWLVVAVLATGWFYGNHRYAEGVADEREARAKIVAEAVAKAVASERAAQLAHDAAEARRKADTDNLRQIAKEAEIAHPVDAKRPCGPVTSSVLGGLRSAGTRH